MYKAIYGLRGLAVAVLAVLSLASPSTDVVAQEATQVSVCGQVEEYTPPTPKSAGSLTMDGDVFTLAPDARVERTITAGPDLCLTFAFGDKGQIASVNDESASSSQGERHSDGETRAGTPRASSKPEAGSGMENAQQADLIGLAAAQGRAESREPAAVGMATKDDLPKTGGAAPSGPFYSLFSLAAAALAGLGAFALRGEAW